MRSGSLEARLRDAGLAAPAAERVAASLRHARLRRSEAEEVARELASHFQEGLASGRPLAELVNDFGDAAVAGRLIGRGVRRRRHAGRSFLRLAEIFSLLVLAAYFVSFARLQSGKPESVAGPGQDDSRRRILAPWSVSAPPVLAAVKRGQALLNGSEIAASSGQSARSAGLLLGAIEAAREIGDGPTPAHDLAALRLTADAASSASTLVNAGALTRSDLSRIAARLDGLRSVPLAWDPSRVRAEFGRLLASMYTSGEDGRLTAAGLRIFQAWKGKARPSLAATLLEPAYFSDPARKIESLRELDRFLALAAAGSEDPSFERERALLESSPWRSLRFVSLAIPLEHVAAAREASRELERAILRASAAAAAASRRS